MNQSHMNTNPYYFKFENDVEEEKGILSKTASFISSIFHKVANSINPFKAQKEFQNIYDLNSSNDPCNYFNNFSGVGGGGFSSSLENPYYGNNQSVEKLDFTKSSKNYLGNKNNDDFQDNQREDYITVHHFCNISLQLKKEIYKDIKRPNYIHNEE